MQLFVYGHMESKRLSALKSLSEKMKTPKARGAVKGVAILMPGQRVVLLTLPQKQKM